MKKLGHRQPVYIFEGIAIRKQTARQRHAHSLTNVGKIAFENACAYSALYDFCFNMSSLIYAAVTDMTTITMTTWSTKSSIRRTPIHAVYLQLSPAT